MIRSITGGHAIALGAMAAGVRYVGSYPGSPSSEVVDELIRLAGPHGLSAEWAANERVSLEVAIGVSIAGGRALVCTKSVGMNVLLDPLMTLSMTPLNGGLVIILGDDPGGYGSQNDQDTRLIASMAEIPMFEPCSPAEACEIARDAFAWSERFGLPIILRETRAFALSVGPVDLDDAPYSPTTRPPSREPWRFVPVPKNVVQKHRDLHNRLDQFASWSEGQGRLRATGDGPLGVLGVGFASRKLADVLGPAAIDGLRVAELSLVHPLPEAALGDWLSRCDRVMVVEETEPHVERTLLQIAHERAPGVQILGKLTGHLGREGELFRSDIRRGVLAWQPDLAVPPASREEGPDAERPPKESYCGGCRYDEVIAAIDRAASARGEKPYFVGDPGCLVTVGDRLDAKYAIGSAIAVAHGLQLTGVGEKVIALFGDSAFFHSAVPALCHAVASRSSLLMFILDNQSTLTSGDQPHPGVGLDALGRPSPKLNIERITAACDVASIRTVSLSNPPTDLDHTIEAAWDADGVRVIIVEIPRA